MEISPDKLKRNSRQHDLRKETAMKNDAPVFADNYNGYSIYMRVDDRYVVESVSDKLFGTVTDAKMYIAENLPYRR